jgi:hypothetical protein
LGSGLDSNAPEGNVSAVSARPVVARNMLTSEA